VIYDVIYDENLDEVVCGSSWLFELAVPQKLTGFLFGEGSCILSMTTTSTGPLADSSFSPSCSCRAVKSDGAND